MPSVGFFLLFGFGRAILNVLGSLGDRLPAVLLEQQVQHLAQQVKVHAAGIEGQHGELLVWRHPRVCAVHPLGMLVAATGSVLASIVLPTGRQRAETTG